jgi:hypothetical protein
MTGILLGLDIETSGTIPGYHRTIQIGATDQDGDAWQRLVSWRHIRHWDKRSAKVHNIPRENVSSLLKPNNKWVEDSFCRYLTSLKPKSTAKHFIVPVGWNVGTFDMKFIFHDFPKVKDYFSYRSIDLNAIAYFLSGNINFQGSQPQFKGLKNLSKTYASNKLSSRGIEAQWHNALYDAQASLYAYEFFTFLLTGEYHKAQEYL